jgi:hypothetical protein
MILTVSAASSWAPRRAAHCTWLTRLLACLVAGGCLALVLASLACAAPLSPSSPLYNPGAPLLDENPEVTADYKGKIIELVEMPPLEAGARSEKRKATLEWDNSVSGPVDQIEYTGVYGASSIHWHLTTFTGEAKDESAKGPAN